MTCDKVPYSSRTDATKQIKDIQLYCRSKKHEMKAYYHHDCGAWHIYTKSKVHIGKVNRQKDMNLVAKEKRNDPNRTLLVRDFTGKIKRLW